jgi:hypothetical protein
MPGFPARLATQSLHAVDACDLFVRISQNESLVREGFVPVKYPDEMSLYPSHPVVDLEGARLSWKAMNDFLEEVTHRMAIEDDDRGSSIFLSVLAVTVPVVPHSSPFATPHLLISTRGCPPPTVPSKMMRSN